MDNQTKWNPDTLVNRERFEAWMAEQKPDCRFRYLDTCGCALSAFVKEATGAPMLMAGGFNIYMRDGSCVQIPTWAYDLLSKVRDRSGYDGTFTIADLRRSYHTLFAIDVMADHTEPTATPQQQAVRQLLVDWQQQTEKD